jgi:hypothetical protein
LAIRRADVLQADFRAAALRFRNVAAVPAVLAIRLC